MSDSEERNARLAQRYAAHVEPINRGIVDRLRRSPGRSETPYVDPASGGVNALLLLLLSDPGPRAAGSGRSSGMISWDNDDDTAEMCARLFAEVGISWQDALPWNVVPWPTSSLRRADWEAGGRIVLDLLDLCPRLVCVLPLGIQVGREWDALRRSSRRAAGLTRLTGPHPSKRGLTFSPDGHRQARTEGVRQLEDVFARASLLIKRE